MLSLPDIDEALTLPDGTIMHPNGAISRPIRGAASVGSIEIPTHTEAKEIVTNTRRALADLPLPPKSTNPVAVVLSYVLFGLSNTDIAIATGLTQEQVANIRMSDAFAAMYESVKTTIIEQETDNVCGFFSAASRAAAMKVTELMAAAENEKVALDAAKDILDRSGHRPADVVIHNGQIDNILRIGHYRKDNVSTGPTIDIEVDK